MSKANCTSIELFVDLMMKSRICKIGWTNKVPNITPNKFLPFNGSIEGQGHQEEMDSNYSKSLVRPL